MNIRDSIKATALVVLATVAFMTTSAFAVTRTWTGNGTPVGIYLYWSDPANWDTGCPTNGDSVVMSPSSSGKNIWADISNLKLENFTLSDANQSSSLTIQGFVTLTGTESSISISKVSVYGLMGIALPEGAKLTLDIGSGRSYFSNIANAFSGSGTIVKTGAGSILFGYSNENFDGVWEFEKGVVYTSSSSSADACSPFGSLKSKAHFYDDDCGSAYNASCEFQKRAEINSEVFFHGRVAVAAYQTITFNGDVHSIPTVAQTQTFRGTKNTSYNRDDSPAGYVFNGLLEIDQSTAAGKFQFLNSGYDSRFLVSINGETLKLGSNNFIYDKESGGQGMTCHFGAAFETTTANAQFTFKDYVSVYCEKPNVFAAGKNLAFGVSGTGVTGAVLDLQGFDQKVNTTLFYEGTGKDAVITSTKGPAVYSTGVGSATTRILPCLNGAVSVEIRSSTYTGSYPLRGGDTTGRIKAAFPVDFTGVSFPNLGALELTGKANAIIAADTVINENIRLDLNGLSSGKMNVATGKNLKVDSVIHGDVDVPAGTYCRAGAGTADNEAAWMGGTDCNGVVTIAADHDPTWVWTGKGDGTTLSAAANWGANAAPDLTDGTLTLDFRHATGDAAITLNADVAVKDVAFPQGGFATFTGDKTLTLAGGDHEIDAAFTGTSSLTYAGTGTLTLKGGVSTTKGTLTVTSGKVVLDSASWQGAVAVAEGAELVVLESCGDTPFGAEEGDSTTYLTLNGKLSLSEGVAATVRGLVIAGKIAKAGVTYGASESAATKQDDVHFASKGVITSLTGPGILLIVR